MNEPAPTRRHFLATGGAAAVGLTLGLRGNKSAAAAPKTVRCGFVGVGGRGTTLLGETAKLEGVEVAAVCDLDAGHRARAAGIIGEAGGKKPAEFEDWKAFLERDDITAVIAAVPCDLHYALYRDTLAAGKHLYGEKPMCLTVAHADDLVERAKKTDTVFQVGFQRRFNPVQRTAVEAFREGIIGEPFEGRGVRFGSGGPYREPGEWFSFRKRSGDWMLEQAVHHWDVFNWALGELPESAWGTGHQDLFKEWDPARDVSDYYTATIKYPGGLILTWTHTWASPPHGRFGGMGEQLIGPKGGIDLSSGFVGFNRGHERDGERAVELTGSERGNRTVTALESFFACVRTGEKPAVGAEEGRQATLLGLLVREAVYAERTVTMKEILETGKA